ncbi:hypothetical protein D3C72_1960290 [compost metagenome]
MDQIGFRLSRGDDRIGERRHAGEQGVAEVDVVLEGFGGAAGPLPSDHAAGVGHEPGIDLGDLVEALVVAAVGL